MIAMDSQPLQLVENIGFKKIVNKLNANYTLPSRKTLSGTFLTEKYSLCSASFREELERVDDLLVTTDTWTSDSGKSYLDLTVHFIWDDKLKSFNLGVNEVSSDHSSANIASSMRSMLDQWNVFHKIVKKAISDYLQKRNHFCMAHTLNLVVKDSLDKNSANLDLKVLKLTFEKCRIIVTYFKQRTKAAYKLRELQKTNGMWGAESQTGR